MALRAVCSAFVLVHACAWLASSPGVARPAPRRGAAAAADATAADEEVDVVVIGSGIGGLSCAAMLAKYGYDVLVCEAHDAPGGAAHEFTRRYLATVDDGRPAELQSTIVQARAVTSSPSCQEQLWDRPRSALCEEMAGR